MTLIESYRSAWNKSKQLNAKLQAFEADQETRRIRIADRYNARIEALKEKRDKLTNQINDEKETRKKELQAQIEEETEAIRKAERIRVILKLRAELQNKPAPSWENAEIKTKTDRYSDDWTPAEALGLLYSDRFTTIRLYIIQNDKPKNKYSLIALGKTNIPTRDYDGGLLDIGWGYINGHLNGCSQRFDIEHNIKSAPTPESLRSYLERNQHKILVDLLTQLEQVSEEIQEVWKTYTDTDLKALSEPLTISEKDAPVVCKLYESWCNWDDNRTEEEGWLELRLHDGFFWIETSNTGERKYRYNLDTSDRDKRPLDFMKIGDKTFLRYTHKGNLLIMISWYRENRYMDIEPPRHQGDEQSFKEFTKTNYEEVLRNFPETRTNQRVEWIHPELLES